MSDPHDPQNDAQNATPPHPAPEDRMPRDQCPEDPISDDLASTALLPEDLSLEDLLHRQRAACRAAGTPSLAQRRDDLARLRAALIDHRPAFERAISADFGHRSAHETAIMEIVPTVSGIDYLSRNLPRFMRDDKRRVSAVFQLAKARVVYQPLGVIGIISPWNYPVNLSLMPLATALAAGNRAMLKPSELTPRTSALLKEMLAKLFDPAQVAVVTGDAEVAQEFSALPFDHLMFTGSTRIGRKVMKAASENLVPVTLELGGKSPVIIAPGEITARAARRIAFGKLANAGQTCVAPDYALIHEDDVAAFCKAFARAVMRLYPKGPASRDYSTIVNDAHFDRLTGLIEDARAKGAEIRQIGADPARASDRPRSIAPTLLTNVGDDMEIMQEEIFGPLLPILSYRSLDAAIAYVNDHPRPLALYYFGREDAGCAQVVSETVSGNVGINSALLHVGQDDIPFGGVGDSGIGAYHGIEGFRRFSHAKGVFAQGRLNAADQSRPPFGRMADRMIRFLLR